jgi:hypothetical protein
MPGPKYIVRQRKGFWDAQPETAPGGRVKMGAGGITTVLPPVVVVGIKTRGTETTVALHVKKTFAEVEIGVFDQFHSRGKGRARNAGPRCRAAGQ